MDYICVIPARYGSTRLPGKPLLDLAGKPLVQWAWESAHNSQASRVVIATDHNLIRQAAENF